MITSTLSRTEDVQKNAKDSCCSCYSHGSNTNAFNHQINSSDSNSSNCQTDQIFIQSKRFSWFEGSNGLSTRTTASNSTEISPPIESIHFNVFVETSAEKNKRESISVQKVLFSEEADSSTTSHSESQDLTPFLNILESNNKNIENSRQPIELISKEVFFNCSLQNNPKDEFGLLEDKILLKNPIQSEKIILNCSDSKDINMIIGDNNVNSLVLEEIQKINRQENEDEMESPTFKLNRIKVIKENSIEERIFRWLDMNGILQVDPTSKREEYYQGKRDGLIHLRKVSKALDGEIKQQNGSLNLCKISSSPLFNRRKLVNKVPQKKHFLEINDEDNHYNSTEITIPDSDQVSVQLLSNLENDSTNSKISQIRQIIHNKHHHTNPTLNIQNTSQNFQKKECGNITLVSPDGQIIQNNGLNSSQSSQNHINSEISKYQMHKQEGEEHEEESGVEINNNLLKQKKSKLFHQSSQRESIRSANDMHNSSCQYFTSNINEQSNQENYNFMNNKPTPNLEIEKNQKRKSLKHLNSIPIFQTLSTNPI